MGIITLEPLNGPACPRCGCRDATILQRPPEHDDDGRGSWWPQGRARCRHCGMAFAFRRLPESQPVDADGDDLDDDRDAEPDFAPAEPERPSVNQRDTAYPVRACPHCGRPETVVASSGKKPKNGMPRIRNHRCLSCGERFKSIDSRFLKQTEQAGVIT